MAVSVITQFESGHTDTIHDAVLDYYGKRLATCSSDHCIKVFELEGEAVTHLADLHGHEGPVWAVAWSHPAFGALLASAGYDGTVAVWREVSPGSWQRVHASASHTGSVNGVAWAPAAAGALLAAASSDGCLSVHSMDETGMWSEARVEDAHLPGATAVSWGPDGRRFASVGADGALRIWRAAEHRAAAAPWVADGPALPAHAGWARDVAWAPGGAGAAGATIATAGQDGRVLIWSELAPGRWESMVLHEFAGRPVWRLSWAVSGAVLAVTEGSGAVSLWKEAAEGAWEQLVQGEDEG